MQKCKSKKIYLGGGLGNVLFQLNYAEKLVELGYSITLCDYLLRMNVLTAMFGWTIHGTFKDIEELGFYEMYHFEKASLVELILLVLSRLTGLCVLGAYFCGYSKEPRKARILFGYFQLEIPISEKLITHIRCKLDTLFPGSEKYPLVVHFRGGDYYKNKYADLGEYYSTAIERLDSEFYVITNDPEMAKKVFCCFEKFKGVSVTSSTLHDFKILSDARKVILTNSTFSWWSAEVGRQEMICQPEPYFLHLDWRPETLKENRRLVNYDA